MSSVSRAIVRAVLTFVIGLLSVVLMLAGLTLPAAGPAAAALAAGAPQAALLKAPTPAVAAKSSRPLPSVAGSAAGLVGEKRRRDAGSVRPYRVRELTSKRDERSTTYLMSDGTRQVTLSTAPVHWRKSSSDEWQPIETEVDPGAGATAFVNESNVFETRFGESRSDLASATGDGWSVALGAVDADGKVASGKVAPKAKGSRVDVADVFGSADLRYTVAAGELKEEILKRPRFDAAAV